MLEAIRTGVADGYNRIIGATPQETGATLIAIEGLATGKERDMLVAQYKSMLEIDVLTRADYKILHDTMLRLLGYAYNPLPINYADCPNVAKTPTLVDHVVIGNEMVTANIEFQVRNLKGMWEDQSINIHYNTGANNSEGLFDGYERVGSSPGFNINVIGSKGENDTSYYSYILGGQRLLLTRSQDGGIRHGNGEWTFFSPYLLKPTLARSLALYEASHVWENSDALQYFEPQDF